MGMYCTKSAKRKISTLTQTIGRHMREYSVHADGCLQLSTGLGWADNKRC